MHNYIEGLYCLSYWSIDWLIDLFTGWLAGWFIYWVTGWLIYLLGDWPIVELSDCLMYLVKWMMDQLTDWSTDCMDWWTDKSTDWLTYLLIFLRSAVLTRKHGLKSHVYSGLVQPITYMQIQLLQIYGYLYWYT